MQKLIQNLLILTCLSGSFAFSYAQAPATVKQGPSGIYLFTGTEIPSGKALTAYRIERSDDSLNWKQLAEIKLPPAFEAFKLEFNRVKDFFPSQPTPPDNKLNQIYTKAVATGSIDSLKGMRISLALRMALGLMYYDTSAVEHIKYRYRITTISQAGNQATVRLSDTISLPFYQVFDPISVSSSSYNQSSVMVKWKSTGKNPAPLFMVYKNKYDVPVVARGNTTRYNMNDTSYFVYVDSVLVTEEGRDMQYFIMPFDQYGNSGKPSQVALVPLDSFNKGELTNVYTEFSPVLSGVQLFWHFRELITLKTVEIYRSEMKTTGFSKLAELAASDTTYLDKQIWPERTYYYYIQLVAKGGKRSRQSKVVEVTIPGIAFHESMKPPVLLKVEELNGVTRLLVEVADPRATHMRVYRGVHNGLVSLPELIEINNKAAVVYTDSTYDSGKMKGYVYAVRNEKEGAYISKLSDELVPVPNNHPDNVEYFLAFPSEQKVELYWDDVVKRTINYVHYTLARQHGPANSKSPLTVLSDNLTDAFFTDDNASAGNQYTYILRLTDKEGNSSEKTYTVTTSPGNE